MGIWGEGVQEGEAMSNQVDVFTTIVLSFSWFYRFLYTQAFSDMLSDEDYGIFDMSFVGLAIGIMAGMISFFYKDYPLAISIYSFVTFVYCMMVDETKLN
jgi:hypothetical protein